DVAVGRRPAGKRIEHRIERPAEFGQSIFHLRRYDRIDLAEDEAGSLHFTQLLRQLLLRDARNGAGEPCEAQRLTLRAHELDEDRYGPFVGDDVERAANATLAGARAEILTQECGFGAAGYGIHSVCIAQKAAFLHKD